jgi:hypothetical protein
VRAATGVARNLPAAIVVVEMAAAEVAIEAHLLFVPGDLVRFWP